MASAGVGRPADEDEEGVCFGVEIPGGADVGVRTTFPKALRAPLPTDAAKEGGLCVLMGLTASLRESSRLKGGRERGRGKRSKRSQREAA